MTASEKRLVYEPALIGFASIRFTDRKLDIDESQDLTLLLPFGEGSKVISWKTAQSVKLNPRDLADKPEEDAFFLPDLPDDVSQRQSVQRPGRRPRRPALSNAVVQPGLQPNPQAVWPAGRVGARLQDPLPAGRP